MMRVVVLADRQVEALRPLTDRSCTALLAVAGKAVLEHSLESLAVAGIRDALVVSGPDGASVAHFAGDGGRWGLSLEHAARRDAGSDEAIAERAFAQGSQSVLFVRGDALRSARIDAFVGRADGLATAVEAVVEGTPAGMWLRRKSAGQARDASPHVSDVARIDVGGRVSWLDSLAEFHQINLDAVAGRFSGLLVSGREIEPGVRAGLRARQSPESRILGPVFLGAGSRVEAGAEILGPVVLGHDVVIDRRATLESAVILAHTYVGKMVEVRRAIVSGNRLIRVDDGSVTDLSDDFLLADLARGASATAPARGSALSGIARRIGGVARRWATPSAAEADLDAGTLPT